MPRTPTNRREPTLPPSRTPQNPIRPALRIYTKAETYEQTRTVESLLTQLSGFSTIAAICRKRHGIGLNRVRTLMGRVVDTWAKEDEANKGTNKGAAIRRIVRMRLHAEGEMNEQGTAWLREPNHPAVAKYEMLLADLQGTREAIKVDVDVRASQACLTVIQGLSAEEVQKYLTKYKENVQLANEMRAMKQLPAKTAPGHTVHSR